MKKLKKILALFVQMALIVSSLVTVNPITVVSALEPELNFDIVTQVQEYGQVVTHLIIDAKAPVKASTLDKDTFSVTAKNNFPTNGNLIYEGEREVTNVFVSDEKSIDKSLDTGRYIIVELKYGFTVTGSSAIAYSGVNYRLNMNYSITQNKDFSFDDDSIASNCQFIQGEVIDLLIEDFDLVTYNEQFIRVYAPKSSKPLPLVIWNHGAGETYRTSNGVNNEGAQIFANEGGTAWLQDGYPCYVVAPQRGTGTNYSRENVISYIESLVASGKVDGSRIYVGGCSAGGGETYNYLREYASVFAAALPICPAGTMNEELATIAKDVPMWFFHSQDDPTINVSRTQSAIATLEKVGAAEVLYTETENLPYREHGENGFYNGHWSWIPPLNNYYSSQYKTNVFDWLFSHQADTSFDIITQVQEYGQDVTHLIIDAGAPVSLKSLDLDTFSVTTKNYFPTNGNLIFDGAREITNIYVNDKKSIDGSTSSGRYIIVELKHGFNVVGASAISYAGVNYKLNMNYSITQNKDFTFANGNVAKDLVYKQGAIKNLIVDDFDLVTYNDQFIRVYAPESTSALPLVLWNHGAGETYRSTNGVNNESAQIIANEGGVAWLQDEYPCYVVAPQRGTGTNYSRNNVIAYINELIASGKVDGNRIYVAGCSAGGGETYNYLREFPSYFAAAAPICPAGSITEEQADLLKDIPMWFVHSADDPTIRVAQTRSAVERLQAAGANEILYTEFENLPYTEDGVDGTYNGHWSWIPLLNNFYSEEYKTNVFDWLFSHEAKPVNINMLEYVTNKANEFKLAGALDNVIKDARTVFENALAKAEALLKQPVYSLTQGQVNNATKDLQAAFEYLNFIIVDKTDLANLILLVEPDSNNANAYIPSTFTAFADALDAARAVMADDNLVAGKDDAVVSEAWTNLINAWTDLRKVPNKENLEALIEKANGIDTSLYVLETVSPFTRALANALTVFNDVEANQEQVDSAFNELNEAMINLEKITDKPVVNPDNNIKPDNSGNNNINNNVVADGKEGGASKNDVAKTGDNNNYPLYLGLGLSSSLGIMLFANKKRKERVSN